MLICSSPKLFAACHVLHRLPMPRHSPYALLCLNYLFKSDLRSFLKLFSLAWIAMSSYIFLFTVTLAFVYFAWRNFNTFVTCFTNYGKTWFFDFSWFFPYLVCHVLLFGFQWASKPSNFRLSGFTTTTYRYLVFVKTDNLSVAWLWAQVDSNHRPRAYQARALTCWAMSPCFGRTCCFYSPYRVLEMMGFEPMTPCLQGRCSPNWATPP